MKEKFSAFGSLDCWVLSSLIALKKANFHDITFESNDNKIEAQKNGPIQLTFEVDNDNTILLIESNSTEDIKEYKDNVAKAFSIVREETNEKIEQEFEKAKSEFKPKDSNRLPAKLHFEETLTPKTNNEVQEAVTVTDNSKVWYKTEWFALLISILVPPVGIYLIWKNHYFKNTERKILIGFFILYTFLWAWLLIILLFPKENSSTEVDINTIPAPSSMEEINAYWNQDAVVAFVTEMPGLMSQYEDLYANSLLGSEYGNEEANEIYPQVQQLLTNVLNVPVVPSTNSAYLLQQKVNEAANLFNIAIQEGQAALDSGDIEAIGNSTVSWNTAENVFYEISYIYDQATQSAMSYESSENNVDELFVEEEVMY